MLNIINQKYDTDGYYKFIKTRKQGLYVPLPFCSMKIVTRNLFPGQLSGNSFSDFCVTVRCQFSSNMH
jgi:hypothetical protein